MLWYHDHALGINRLNVYAGLLGTFFIRDSVEDALNLPKGKYELPLILYDRLLRTRGSYYPVSPDPNLPGFRRFLATRFLSMENCFPISMSSPENTVFGCLNGSNARFYNLSFVESACRQS